MNEEEVLRMAENVRRNSLKEAAKVICIYCSNSDNPWSDTATTDGSLYEHYEKAEPRNTRPCAAGAIWKLIDAG